MAARERLAFDDDQMGFEIGTFAADPIFLRLAKAAPEHGDRDQNEWEVAMACVPKPQRRCHASANENGWFAERREASRHGGKRWTMACV